MFDFLNKLYVAFSATYDPIVIKSGKMTHILIKRVYVEFHRDNTIIKSNIIAKHIS